MTFDKKLKALRKKNEIEYWDIYEDDLFNDDYKGRAQIRRKMGYDLVVTEHT